MKKKHLFLAATAIFIASCSDNTYLGDQAAIGSAGPISFESSTPNLTRTTADDAKKLHYNFNVFGVKTVSSSDQAVFATSSDLANGTPYKVWFVDGTGNSTTSNSNNWEYVGTQGQTYGTNNTTEGINGQVTLDATQTIKYWDNNATNYYFQAWSDVNTYAVNDTKLKVENIARETMTITGTPAQLANFWISDLQSGAPASFTSKVVQFTFRKAATKVRLGIYETVPGYHVRNLKFKYTPKSGSETTSVATTTTSANAILTGKFVGASNSSATSFDVKYEGTPQRAIIELPSSSTAATEHFDFGTFGTNTTTGYYLGETSTSPTWANASATAEDYYTVVFPNTATGNTGNMTLKIDYELYNEVSQEVIEVKDKTAIVPEAYMSWKPNFAYTYLFKITDDTLTPITLDAVVVTDESTGKQETITTVTEPSITTFGYDETNNKYVASTNDYAAGNDIYVTIMDNGSVVVPTPHTNFHLYSNIVSSDPTNFPITEASVKEAIEVTSTGTKKITFDHPCNEANSWFDTHCIAVTSVPAEDGTTKTVNAVKLTGLAAGTYAVQYRKSGGGDPTYTEKTGLKNGDDVSSYYTLGAFTHPTAPATYSASAGITYYEYDATNKCYKVKDGLSEGDDVTSYFTFGGTTYTAVTSGDTYSPGITYYEKTAGGALSAGNNYYKVIIVH